MTILPLFSGQKKNYLIYKENIPYEEVHEVYQPSSQHRQLAKVGGRYGSWPS